MKANNDIFVVLIGDKHVFVDLLSAVFENLVSLCIDKTIRYVKTAKLAVFWHATCE
jgi:hypothetical protein